MSQTVDDIKPILPKTGQLITDELPEFVMCKPRLIPLKYVTLEKLEKMQKFQNTSTDETKGNEENQF